MGRDRMLSILPRWISKVEENLKLIVLENKQIQNSESPQPILNYKFLLYLFDIEVVN